MLRTIHFFVASFQDLSVLTPASKTRLDGLAGEKGGGHNPLVSLATPPRAAPERVAHRRW